MIKSLWAKDTFKKISAISLTRSVDLCSCAAMQCVVDDDADAGQLS